MPIKKISGSKMYIGPRALYKNKVTLADFSATPLWVPMAGWLTAGDLGTEQEMITQLLIDQGITEYSKGPLSFPASTQTFSPEKTDPGQIAFKAAIKSCHPYQFRFDWGADCAIEQAVTISQATPGVITWTAHPLIAGDAVVFSTTGALPTGLVAGTTYFVVAPALNTFQVSAVPGGSPINTTAAGSGTHTVSAMPGGETEYVLGFALPGVRSGGEANGTRQQTFIIQPIAESVII